MFDSNLVQNNFVYDMNGVSSIFYFYVPRAGAVQKLGRRSLDLDLFDNPCISRLASKSKRPVTYMHTYVEVRYTTGICI